MKKIAWILLAVVVTACGSDSVDKKQLTYNFELNGCKTGEHTFDSKDSYCQGLKDDSLNNGCAKSMRDRQFGSDCQ